MLIELADVSRRLAKTGSAKARLTVRWQSSNLPSTATVVTLPPMVVICLRWRSETSLIGNSTTTRMRWRPAKAWATALAVSPEVAVRMTRSSPPSRVNSPIQRAIMRAAKSLNDAVGPRSRRQT